MQRRDLVVLNKITSEIDIALEIIRDVDFKKFDSNEIMKRALCMTVINIGELVKTLSDDLRIENKQVPWRNIAGFRDIAAHKYQTLNMMDVYQTVTEDYPQLRENIIAIIEN